MKRSLNSVILIAGLFFLPLFAQAQLNAIKKQTRAAIADGRYEFALEAAKAVLSVDENDPEFLYLAGKAAFETRAYSLADSNLTVVANSESSGSYPETFLLLAEIHFRLQDYDPVLEYAQTFLDRNLGTPAQREKALRIIENCEWAMEEWTRCSDGIEIRRLDEISTEQSNFPVSFSNNRLQVVSYPFPKSEEDNKWCKCNDPCRFEMRWNRFDVENNTSNNSVNIPGPTGNMSHFTYAGDNHRIYFSDCPCDESAGSPCALYYREQKASGGWGEAVRLPSGINATGASIKQPYLVSNPYSNTERLFYVSDQPGGKGGWDIWYVDIHNDSIGTSVNLEAVNTPDDEITPYFHAPTQILYFSSNSLAMDRYTLGGMDIYEVTLDGDRWGTPVNLGCNVNSSHDDTYYILDDASCRAYFASTRRPDGDAAENKTPVCCPDIYEVNYINEVDLIVQTFNYCTREPLTGVAVDIRNTTGGRNELIGSEEAQAVSEYRFENVLFDRHLRATGSRNGYIYDDSTGSTFFTICEDTEVYLQLYLKPLPRANVVVKIYDECTKEPITNAQVDLNSLTTGIQCPLSPFQDDGPNAFLFESIGLDEELEAVVSSANYESATVETSTVGITFQNCTTPVIELPVFLQPKPLASLTVQIWDRNQRDLPLQPNTLVLLERDGVSSFSPVHTITLPDDGGQQNQFVFEDLDPEKYYTVQVRKQGYLADPQLDTDVDFIGAADSPCAPKEKLIDILLIQPLDLFFYDDEPKWDNDYYAAEYDYGYYYDDYKSRIQDFRSRCCDGTPEQVDSFFVELDMAKARLDTLSKILIRRLSVGRELAQRPYKGVTLEISGFASPTGGGPYNEVLSHRRANSILQYLIKEFETQGYGDLAALLNLKVDPKGRNQAPALPCNRGSTCCTIYGLTASKERRVAITNIFFE